MANGEYPIQGKKATWSSCGKEQAREGVSTVPRHESSKVEDRALRPLRAGFKECWQKQDYPTIVQMAKRVPEAVIQEDQAILMYYDNALMRTGE